MKYVAFFLLSAVIGVISSMLGLHAPSPGFFLFCLPLDVLAYLCTIARR